MLCQSPIKAPDQSSVLVVGRRFQSAEAQNEKTEKFLRLAATPTKKQGEREKRKISRKYIFFALLLLISPYPSITQKEVAVALLLTTQGSSNCCYYHRRKFCLLLQKEVALLLIL
jgi:hypothetical protein